jgi:hypothetical protein
MATRRSIHGAGFGIPGTIVVAGARSLADDHARRARSPVGAPVQVASLGRTDGQSRAHSLRRAGDRSGNWPSAESESAPGCLHSTDGVSLDRPMDGGDGAFLFSGAPVLWISRLHGKSRPDPHRELQKPVRREGSPPKATTWTWIPRCRSRASPTRPR